MTNGLNYNLIKRAVAGDKASIDAIVCIYEPYINTLSSKRLFDEDGKEYMIVDIDMQDHLKTKLLNVIKAYKIA